MIYSVCGIIIALSEETVCIEQNGITWEIFISKNSFLHFNEVHNNQSDGNPIRVYTCLQANDKGISLYGFYSLAERSVFITLLKVNGIGPKVAIRILSHSTPELLIQYIQLNDVQSLGKIPGIGSKKASKILLALEGVYVVPHSLEKKRVANNDSSVENIAFNTLTQNEKDVVNGLLKMGYRLDAIMNTIDKIVLENKDDNIDEGVLMRNIIMNLEN